jgi:hypothetical protein
VCRRRAGFGCLIAFLLIAGGAGWFFYDLQKADPALVAAAKPPTANDTQAAQTTVTQIEKQFKNPAPSTPKDPSTFEVTLTEQEANQLLRAHPDVRPQLDSKGIEGAQLEFKADQITVTARVPLGPVKARITISGTLTAEDGMLRYRTIDAKVGALKAPDAARADLDSTLSDAFDKLNRDGQARIEQVEVNQGKLVLRGHKKVGG